MTDLVTGDTGSKLRVIIKDQDGVVMNLTGCTVRYRWEGTSGVVTKVATITDAPNGVTEYQFVANDIFAPKMKIEVETTDPSGLVTTSQDLIELTVREQIG